jgi:PAS domain S-box-containing protein
VATAPISIVIVDDAVEVRGLARTQLRLSGRFEILGEAGTGHEAIELCRQLQPEMVLLDVSMPEMDGLEALARIREVAPRSRVVMFTGFDEAGLGDRARELGAAALIEKSSGIAQLADHLVAICNDGVVGPTADERPEELDRAVLDDHLERFREVFEEAAIGMATMTLTGRVIRTNKAMADLIGHRVGDLVGVPYTDLAAPHDAAAISLAIHQAQDGTGRVVQFEHMPRDSSDSSRLLLGTAAPVRDARGRPLYLFLQCQDVTAQRRAEEELRQSEQRFRLLVEAVQDYAIFMLDPEGRVMSWNAGAQRIKGYRSDEIIGRHFRVFYPEEAKEIEHPEHELLLARARGRYEEEGWRIRKDGSRFWASVVITAVYDSSGTLIGFAKVTRDMSERRQALLDAEREAADQARFLAVTAHELRSPIGVLAGSSKLLVEHLAELTDAERSELMESISVSAARLQRLLRDLLTAARLEARAVQLKWQDIDVAGLLAGTVTAARSAQPGAHTELDVPAGLRVRGESDRLAQAVDNLITNALRYGAAPVSVRARAVADQVEISVSDSGPGVPADLQDRLFERFASGTSPSGTGLGLYIVRELARAHGGEARYGKDDAGRPSFTIVLPAPPPGVDALDTAMP